MFLKMDMDAVSGMLPCDRLTPLPPRAPARPPKAHAAARIDWSIQDLPHKMATSPRYLIALYKEGIASKDAVITQLRAERHTLEAQIKSANGMETLLQNELEAAIRVQNDLKEKLTTSLQAAKEKLTAAEAAYGKKVDHLSEAMHALTLAQMDLQASQRERRTVETINTSLSTELAAKDGDILALKEALRIAQRAVDREAKRATDEVNAPTARLSADQIRQQRSTNGAGLCACPYVCSVHTKTPGQQTDAMGIPTHNPDGSELSRNKRKAYEAAHAAQEPVPAPAQVGGVFRMTPPAPEPSKKPVPAPAQVLPRAHVAGDLLKTILTEASTKHLRRPELPLTRLTADQIREKRAATGYDPYVKASAPAEPGVGGDEDLVSDDAIETLLRTKLDDTPDVPLGTLLGDMFKGLHAKETSTDDVLPALIKALDVVGKKAFSEEPERAQEVLNSLKDEACNVQ